MTFLTNETVERLRELATRPELPADRYVIVAPIGRGGMGAVYAARDSRLERDVAIKVSNAVAPGGFDERLRREARVLARLEHPGIVPIHDAGLLDDGRWFYVMKLIRGETLAQHAAALDHEAARLAVFERVAETVAFAHAAGILHRDLKPSNVMVGQFGEVLVLDWGVARILADDESAGTRIGTVGFMAPEQARGEAAEAGPPADVYALGAILFWMWTQDVAPSVPEDVSKRLIVASPPPSRRLAAIITKCLSPRAADRYATAADLIADLALYRQGSAVSAYRESAMERTARWLVRYQTFVWLVLAYLLMRFAFALWWR